MVNSLWPVNAAAGSPSYSGRMLRQTGAVLLGGATPTRPLGARSGVRHNSGSVTTVSGTTWTVNPHAGALDLEPAAEAGPYLYSMDAAVSGNLAAADATNPRIDITYLQLSGTTEADGITFTPTYLAGTPGATSTTRGAAGGPPVLPARAMELSQITVPKVGGGAATVVQTYPMLRTMILPVRSQAERDLLPLVAGWYVDRLDTNLLERCDGATWNQVTPLPVSLAAGASGTLVAGIPYGVGTFVVSEGSSVMTGILDGVTFTKAGLVSVHILIYQGDGTRTKQGWINTGSGTSAKTADFTSDRASLVYTTRVAANTTFNVNQFIAAGANVPCTASLSGMFFPSYA